MKKLVSPSLLMAILIMIMAASAPVSVRAQNAGLISSILSRMERNRRDLKSLRSDISMFKYDARLRENEPKVSGTVLYMPGAGRSASVRIDWQYPARETLTVFGGEYTLFRPRLNMAYVGNTAKQQGRAGGMMDFLTMSSQQVKTRFEPLQDIYEETLWGGVSTYHFKLVPIGKASYKYAEIWVDGSGMPVQTKVVEKNDDWTTVRLTQVQKNASISTDEFKLKLDSKVRIVKS